MKRHLLFIITSITLLWSATCHALGDGTLGYGGGVNDNPHNLSSQSSTPGGETDYKASTETQICIFCHTPHGATANAPLWGRPDSTETFNIRAGLQISNSTIVNTTLYGNTTDPNEYPNGASKLCLSCHDGVTALGILSDGYEIEMVSSDLATAIDLTMSHPVSFVYNGTVQSFLGASYIYPGAGSIYLETDSGGVTRVQCTSCHQPHQDTKGTGSGIYPFWKGDGLASDYDPVCQACHTSTPTTYTIPNSHTH